MADVKSPQIGQPVRYKAVKDGIAAPGTVCAATITNVNNNGTVDLDVIVHGAGQHYHRNEIAQAGSKDADGNTWEPLITA